jgi:hypothetical protein
MAVKLGVGLIRSFSLSSMMGKKDSVVVPFVVLSHSFSANVHSTETGSDPVDWVYLVIERDKKLAFVNAITYFRVPKMLRIRWLAE